jgi:leucine rich repeat domain-containing protein
MLRTPSLPGLLISLLLCAAHAAAQDFPTFDELKSAAGGHSLPLVDLRVDLPSVGRNGFVAAEVEIFDPQASPADARTVFHGLVRYRGNTSLRLDKKSFALKLTDGAGKDLDANLFGIRKENSWVMNAMAIDRLRMRDRLCFDLWNAVSRTPYPTPFGDRNGTEGRFVELFVNGRYHGLYCFGDKVDRKLLALKKARVEGDGSVLLRGLLYKGEAWTSAVMLGRYDPDAPTDTTAWNGWGLQYPDDYPSAEAWLPLAELIDFCNDGDFAAGHAAHFYLDNMVDYGLLLMALNIRDANFKNAFLSTPDINAETRFLVTPWDMDTSLGGEWNGQYFDELSGTATLTVSLPFKFFYNRDIGGFRGRLRQRWEQWAAGAFHPTAVDRRLDEYAEAFTASGAWQRERQRWDGNPVPLKEDIDDELDYVKDWYRRNYFHLCELLGTVPTAIGTTAGPTPDARPAEIFTLDGRRAPRLQKGINLVRYPDGRTIKIKK